jgi:topoisomerase-4 subunit A
VLPVKFPLLLAQGVEGIAVGLSTKVLPHNFIEICEASVAFLKGKKYDLYPDFNTGGQIDISNYNEGRKGSKVRVRARIEDLDKKILVIKDIPFGTTTASLMESIVKANDAGKIKIKKVIDNTAKDVEIQVHLAPGVSPDITIEALYAFTECEVSISPNACVIIDDKPNFLGVSDLLRICTESTMSLLKKELEIRRHELLEKLLFASLEKIFIENRIYRNIEECETWEAVIQTIDEGLEPFKPSFYRTITRDDIIRLTEIKIKRISRYDSFKADELMRDMQTELEEVENNLVHLRDYTILWFESLKKKYGKGRERKTEIKTFDTISAAVVAADNEKLYVNRAEGFIGFGIKKDEYVCDCSDLDDVIVIRRDGKCKVVRIGEKVFVGKDILYAGVFRKGNDRMVYNLLYMDGKSGYSYVKRFQVLGITRDKEYDLTKGEKGSKVLYVSANPNGEAELLTVTLTPGSTARTKVFDFDFASQLIKGRDSQGNILTKYPVKKVVFKSAGISTLGGIDIFYDNTIGKLNTESRGALVGNFQGDDKILVLYKDGSYELTGFDLSNRYDESNILLLSKFDPDGVISAIYFDGGSKNNYLKRFKIETTTTDKKFLYISEAKNSKLLYASIAPNPVVEIHFRRDKSKTTEKALYDLAALMDVKGWKAMGNKITAYTITDVVEVAQEQPEQVAPENQKQADANATEKGGQMSLFD